VQEIQAGASRALSIHDAGKLEAGLSRADLLLPSSEPLDLRLPGTDFSIRAAVRFVREYFCGGMWCSPEIRVTSEIVEITEAGEDRLVIRVRVSDGGGAIQETPHRKEELDSLLQRGAESLVGLVAPTILAAYHFGRKDPELAQAFARRAIGRPPTRDDAAAYRLLGILAADQGEYTTAVSYYERALDSDPYDAESVNSWGLVHSYQRDHAAAIERFESAARLDPHDPEAFRNWGIELSEMGDHDGAIAKFMQAIALDPTDSRAFNDWGIALQDKGDHEGAIEKYRHALDLDPTNPYPANNWGDILYDEGDKDGAAEKYALAVSIEPDYVRALTSWGRALADLGNAADAIDQYERALEIAPDHATAWRGLAAAHRLLDQTAAAERADAEAARLEAEEQSE
jgi:tetratricopeptide (TPR) repeat protein